MDENKPPSATSPDPEEWVSLGEPANEPEAAIVAGFLVAEGIPARVDDRSFHQAPAPDNEDFKEIAILVPRSREAEARALIASRQKAFEEGLASPEAVLTDEGPAEIEETASTEPEPEPAKGEGS
ncbi:hypothetical protein FBQ97_18685 [Acidobacteria bacterium ACD]|nr:MAG: hypothetical protein EDX89_15705 [Acidobacteriota bacterium]MCE7960624.1 hypothetical protein [Acidobacteria bacterium ACB2]MDL1951817.1 hypothetical protein [Acidobacteria bacterium ACD]